MKNHEVKVCLDDEDFAMLESARDKESRSSYIGRILRAELTRRQSRIAARQRVGQQNGMRLRFSR